MHFRTEHPTAIEACHLDSLPPKGARMRSLGPMTSSESRNLRKTAPAQASHPFLWCCYPSVIRARSFSLGSLRCYDRCRSCHGRDCGGCATGRRQRPRSQPGALQRMRLGIGAAMTLRQHCGRPWRPLGRWKAALESRGVWQRLSHQSPVTSRQSRAAVARLRGGS